MVEAYYTIVKHVRPWYTMTYHGVPCYDRVLTNRVRTYSRIPWCTMVYHDIPWYIMVYHAHTML